MQHPPPMIVTKVSSLINYPKGSRLNRHRTIACKYFNVIKLKKVPTILDFFISLTIFISSRTQKHLLVKI